jgi:hypothetical protein
VHCADLSDPAGLPAHTHPGCACGLPLLGVHGYRQTGLVSGTASTDGDLRVGAVRPGDFGQLPGADGGKRGAGVGAGGGAVQSEVSQLVGGE